MDKWLKWEKIDQAGEITYTPRTGHAAVANDESIYVFGGIDIDGNRNNDLYRFDFNTMTWKKLMCDGTLPSKRSGAKAVYFDPILLQTPNNQQQRNTSGRGELVIFGGYINKDVLHCNDLFKYDVISNQWHQIQTIGEEIPAKRTDHSMVRYGKFIYIFGGRGENRQILKDLKRFNYHKKIWKDIKGEGAQIVPRFGHVAVTFEHSMYVFGGWDGMNCLDDLFQYSYVTNIWYEIRRCVGEKPSPRYRHEALVFQDNLYIFGGVDQNQIRFNNLYQFNFNKRMWTKVLTSGCVPSPRTFHKIVNIGSILFLLGGFDGDRKNDLHMLKLETQEEEKTQEKSPEVSLSEIQEDKIAAQSDIDLLIKMLNEQVKEISKKIQREEDKNLCKICFSREIDTVLMDCCHFILCFNCTTNLKNCPICRSGITRVIKTRLF